MNKKILIIAAHPDDEVLGCGGTINKYSKLGYSIDILFVSDGENSRLSNKKKKQNIVNKRKLMAIRSAKILGAKKPNFLSFPDQELDSLPLLKIIKEIEKYINLKKPNIIFTHTNACLNIDHKIVNNAVITACRPKSFEFVKKIYFFEILSSTEWNIKDNKLHFDPNFYVDISSNVKNKIKALKVYHNETRSWPHSRSYEGVNTLAKYRGMTVGIKFAEAFYLARGIE